MKKLLALAVLFPTVTLAHGDHDNHLLEGLQHALSSPEHAWPLTIGLAFILYVIVKKCS